MLGDDSSRKMTPSLLVAYPRLPASCLAARGDAVRRGHVPGVTLDEHRLTLTLSDKFLATASSGMFVSDVARTLNRDPDESMTYVPSKKHSWPPDHEHVIIVKGATSRAGAFPPLFELNASMVTVITSQATITRVPSITGARPPPPRHTVFTPTLPGRFPETRQAERPWRYEYPC